MVVESALEIQLNEEEASLETVHVTSTTYDDDPLVDTNSTQLLTNCTPHIWYILAIIYAVTSSQINRQTEPSDVFTKTSQCIRSRTDGMNIEELWSKTPMIINQCSQRRFLKIRGYSNRDEIKMHMIPNENAFSESAICSIVSLGVGRDVQAERKMKEDMPNCSFFGADPVKEPNLSIFEEVGVFYHIAVGGKNGTSLATVLEPDTANYRIREVDHVDIATFLEIFIRKQFIDQLIVDIEWEEYDVLPYLLKSGELESSDVVICQINIEIHAPDYEQKVLFFGFFQELQDDHRYVPLVADRMLGHMRLYLLNYEHKECRRRYVAKP